MTDETTVTSAGNSPARRVSETTRLEMEAGRRKIGLAPFDAPKAETPKAETPKVETPKAGEPAPDARVKITLPAKAKAAEKVAEKAEEPVKLEMPAAPEKTDKVGATTAERVKPEDMKK